MGSFGGKALVRTKVIQPQKMVFDGVAQLSTQTHNQTGNYTVECWVKPQLANKTRAENIFIQGTPGNFFVLHMEEQGYGLYMFVNTTYSGSSGINRANFAGEFRHIAVMKLNNVVYLKYNGTNVFTMSVNAQLLSPIQILGNNHPQRSECEYHTFRTSNIARYGTDIYTVPNPNEMVVDANTLDLILPQRGFSTTVINETGSNHATVAGVTDYDTFYQNR